MRHSIATIVLFAVVAPAVAHADAALALAPSASTPAMASAPSTSMTTSSPSSGEGMTAELGLGVSMVNGGDLTTLGVGLGVGVWQSSRTAVTLRVVAALDRSELGGVAAAGFVGPSIQHRISDKLWLGGGAGLAVVAASPAYARQSVIGAFDHGFALDLRVGYSFASSLNVSLELTPQWYGESNQSTVGLLVGYQLR